MGQSDGECANIVVTLVYIVFSRLLCVFVERLTFVFVRIMLRSIRMFKLAPRFSENINGPTWEKSEAERLYFISKLDAASE